MCKFNKRNNGRRIDPCMRKGCKCGCGEEIIRKPHHKYTGTPKYIRFHYVKTNEFRENRKKLQEDQHSKYNSVEYRQKLSNSLKGRIFTKETKEKLRLSKLGDKNPNFGKIPEHLKDIHKNWREKNPQRYKEHQRNAGKKAFLSCPRVSKIELKFQEVMNELNIDFIPQFDFQLGFADILIKPNIVLFIDGDFWHGNPIRFKTLSQKQVAQKIKDERQNLFLRLKGYHVIRLWEYNLKNLSDSQIKDLILKIIKRDKEGVYYIPEVVQQ